MGGGWAVGVKTWILVLSFKPKLNQITVATGELDGNNPKNAAKYASYIP